MMRSTDLCFKQALGKYNGVAVRCYAVGILCKSGLIHHYCSYFCGGQGPAVYLNSLRSASYNLSTKPSYLAVVALFATELVRLCLHSTPRTPLQRQELAQAYSIQSST